MYKLSNKQKLKSLAYVTMAGSAAFGMICFYKGDEKFFKNVLMPFVRILDPEKAHNLAVWISQHRLLPKTYFNDPDILKVKVFGREFPNPVGIAAGFDKDGKAIMGLKDMGFGFVEIGSVTPLPQSGNSQPRVFRLHEDLAVINRYGFNNEGHTEVLKRIQNVKEEGETCIIGVNLGKNKTSEDAIKDYVDGIKRFGAVSDYLVINISSPNTPNLRKLQSKEKLIQLLKPLKEARDSLEIDNKPPLLLKLAPDLTFEERKDVADVILRDDCKVDGLIVCNTTVERPLSLKSANKSEVGGLSGKPLTQISTDMIKDMRRLAQGIPIIGVGGVSSGKDAYDKIKAGASLVQIYSAMVYDGPPVVTKIKKELIQQVQKDGYKNISEAIGADVK